MITEKRTWEVAIALPIQTYDVDFAGIVSNIVYIRWLEDLRLKILESYFPLDELMTDGYCPTVASTQIEYKQALRLFDRPTGKMWISKLGRLRVTLQAEIMLEEQIAATATQVGFLIDPKTMRPLGIPQKLKHAYTAC